MTLSDYIKSGRGNGAALAKAIGVSPSLLSQIAHRSSSTTPARCVAIERATGGLVKREELRPDWKEIWPELENCPCAKEREGV